MTLAEFRVAYEGNTRRSSPGYFVKISFPRYCWQEPCGLGNSSGREASRWAAALGHLCVYSYLHLNLLHGKIQRCIQSSAFQPRPGTKDTMKRGGGWHGGQGGRIGRGAPVPGLALTARDLLTETAAGHLLPSGRPPVCRHYPQAMGDGLGPLKFGQFGWCAALLLQSSLGTSRPFLDPGDKRGNSLNALAY